jgi:hypothetical protein
MGVLLSRYGWVARGRRDALGIHSLNSRGVGVR